LTGRERLAGYTFVENNVGVASFTKMAVSDDFTTLIPDAIVTRTGTARSTRRRSSARSETRLRHEFHDFQMDISAR
jgi:hypothetical protein